ncbi:hypothetical protein SKAU_G00372590 [Synaphobranchus kaupii]|uniref:Uncharacterized protein n=1 Tax=Synaphobranchus kaupii TaxID=118154 RepID=A0A9Q1IDZ9_SYNKA|nr:hypothetical protein SKAU_G00372590 [Synaphobranchus kaupii]
MRLKIQGGSLPVSLATNDTRTGVPLTDLAEVVVPRHRDDSSSSIIALMVVAALACAVIVASLVTFHCHRWQLHSRKLRRAQAEYESDRSRGVERPGPGSSLSA